MGGQGVHRTSKPAKTPVNVLSANKLYGRWLMKNVLCSTRAGKIQLRDTKQMRYQPPVPPQVFDAGVPTVETFFASKLFVWCPADFYTMAYICTTPDCKAKKEKLIKKGLHKITRRVVTRVFHFSPCFSYHHAHQTSGSTPYPKHTPTISDQSDKPLPCPYPPTCRAIVRDSDFHVKIPIFGDFRLLFSVNSIKCGVGSGY